MEKNRQLHRNRYTAAGKSPGNKDLPDPKLDASKHEEGYAKLQQLSSLSILPSGKPGAKQMPINQLTIVPPPIKSEQK